MQHPFINDLSSLTVDELQDKMTDLTGKLTFSARMNNTVMSNQLLMALGSYQTEYNARMEAIYKKQNIQNTIRISKDAP